MKKIKLYVIYVFIFSSYFSFAQTEKEELELDGEYYYSLIGRNLQVFKKHDDEKVYESTLFSNRYYFSLGKVDSFFIFIDGLVRNSHGSISYLIVASKLGSDGFEAEKKWGFEPKKSVRPDFLRISKNVVTVSNDDIFSKSFVIKRLSDIDLMLSELKEIIPTVSYD